jgi:hypothetical protein
VAYFLVLGLCLFVLSFNCSKTRDTETWAKIKGYN